MKKKILLGIVALLVIVQFFQIDKTPKSVNPDVDFQSVTNPPKDVLNILKDACFDCHSEQTVYPWYAGIQPMGWWLRGHARGGRMHLNFSEFGKLNAQQRSDILREAAEEIEHKTMPLKSYTWMHPEAQMSDVDKAKVITWLKNPMPADLSYIKGGN